ncbi:MAG TPA: winged helix-turn-helix domain-containing protein [Tahibacter sp.]|uniref:winged helix-turn-helix domain-containing protein n=1 Tax=Tahibacter sp. TaxID=2056211 RepID=UPI002C1EB595|nr:winged helix-turn-helix domain-containing protein [Tahibacter sp.]HSX58650.1 winged helix-turn-helix domain-containing protein [Tahibacter sp.]
MADRTLPWPADTRLVRLGEIEIDPRYRTVSRAGVMHELNPRCFELLLLFLSEPRTLHTRDAIFRRVWRGAVVEDANLTTSIWLLRRALGGAAKQWIRTVSKQGYIFDPPAGVEFELVHGDDALLPAAAAEAETPVVADDATAAAVDAPEPANVAEARPAAAFVAPAVRAAPPITRGWTIALAAAVCLSLMLLTGGLLGARGRDAAPLRVVLVVAPDSSLPDSQRWPAYLLQRWLAWQLRSSPRVELRNPADLAADGSEAVVLIDLAAPAQGSEWRIAAHFRGAVAQTPVVRVAPVKHLVGAIAEVSDEVFARLAASENYAGPELRLDASAAQQLATALEAEDQHRWGDAVRSYTGVVTSAPEMGFARFRLARALAQLGQRGAAQAELVRADGWTAELPEFLGAPLRAEGLMIREQHLAAADAFAALREARRDDVAEYRIAEATSLHRAGRPRDAAERLEAPLPNAPGAALGWLVAQSDIAIANQDFRASIASATQALELAQMLGWEHEQAQAAFALADARSGARERVDVALLERAEQGFAATGDRLGVLGARLRAQLERDDRVSGETLDQLLAEARSAGNARIEIEALRRVAVARFRAGDAQEAHQRFAQAAAVAESTGHRIERRRLDLPLLQLDVLRLDFAGADQRLKLLDAEPQQGSTAYAIGLNRARLQYWRGDFDGALRTLERTESALRSASAGNLPQSMAAMNCMRAAVRIVQGRPADARTEFRSCRATGVPAFEHLADIGEAELAIQAGDVTEARRLLAPMTQAPQDTRELPDRWGLAMEVAPLLARIGDFDTANALVDRTLPLTQRSGYRMLEASLRITRAEIALAEGRNAEAAREIEIADAVAPPDYWYERRRIRTVRALVLQGGGRIEQSARELDALHNDARANGDVLGELLVHSLMDANAAASRCSDERRLQLLAASGMRGASDLWMSPAGRDRTRLVSSAANQDWGSP